MSFQTGVATRRVVVLGRINKMALSKWKKSLFFNSTSSPAHWRCWLSRHTSGYRLKLFSCSLFSSFFVKKVTGISISPQWHLIHHYLKCFEFLKHEFKEFEDWSAFLSIYIYVWQRGGSCLYQNANQETLQLQRFHRTWWVYWKHNAALLHSMTRNSHQICDWIHQYQ